MATFQQLYYQIAEDKRCIHHAHSIDRNTIHTENHCRSIPIIFCPSVIPSSSPPNLIRILLAFRFRHLPRHKNPREQRQRSKDKIHPSSSTKSMVQLRIDDWEELSYEEGSYV